MKRCAPPHPPTHSKPAHLPASPQRGVAISRRKSAPEGGEKGRRETTTEPSEAEGLPEGREPFILRAVINEVCSWLGQGRAFACSGPPGVKLLWAPPLSICLQCCGWPRSPRHTSPDFFSQQKREWISYAVCDGVCFVGACRWWWPWPHRATSPSPTM